MRDAKLLVFARPAPRAPAWARSQTSDILPSVELFKQFAATRMLVPPEAPAREIVAFLESDGALRFQERRLGQ